eukprot:m.154126 g.154126  ORF g.154126 m.154126 type:complete len:135 (+) comp38632_c0_seq18:23-427(+)
MSGDSDQKRVSLAYKNLSEIPRELFEDYGTEIEELDLSCNRISDFRSLNVLSRLNTLILDQNDLTAHVKLPPLSTLHTLWVNHNQIANLSLFVDNVVASCPNLRYLCMMNNEAAPSYFNKGNFQDYQDYRLVIS